jgi:hypothetical protein
MLLMSLATLLAFDLQVLMCCPRPLPLVITASSAKVGFSQGNTWGVTPYAVILTRRKLRHYFESHPVTVVSSFPLGEIYPVLRGLG